MRPTAALLFSLLLCLPAAAQWTAPTPEELSMTAQPEAPGAAAVYLFREETTDDHLHMFSIYVRLKVLTERGKDFANVELPYSVRSDGGSYIVEDIQGRTIHPDGKVIPFTGKPMLKTVEKAAEYKVMKKVFTLPDVEIGSILEYRYKTRGDDHWFSAPQWYIQSDLYTRKAHYLWRPTDKQLTTNDDRGQLTNTVAWTPILPPGAAVTQRQLPAIGQDNGQVIIELNVHDIPPSPTEELMPPVRSFSYRVLFYYTPYRKPEEFWKSEGKHWAKLQDKFIGPGSGVTAAVQKIVAPGDTDEQKLKKLYAAVMELENTDFTRTHSQTEEKAAGLGQTRTTDDILNRKRGGSDQINALFVAMARAAGMKAYVMAVTNRDRSLFNINFLNMSQLDDDLAIVTVGGKERFFDPGSRFCPYGHLAWKHSFTSGVREIEGGNTAITTAPGDPYTYSRVQRIAVLTLDEQGVASGTVTLTFMGSPALRWRQEELGGDETAVRRDLQTEVEHLLPGGMEVKVDAIDALKAYEQPLIVRFSVKGAIGSPTGKRLLIPGDLFEGNAHALFPHDKRELPVYFDYSRMVQDVVRINLPASFAAESLPTKESRKFKQFALYDLATESSAKAITVRRNLSLGTAVYTVEEYPELRSFYSAAEAKDQEPIVLSRSGSGQSTGGR